MRATPQRYGHVAQALLFSKPVWRRPFRLVPHKQPDPVSERIADENP